MRDRVTVSLYSVETNEDPGYKQTFLNEISNIEKIRNGLVNAARQAGREPPEFIVSILLIPDWSRENNSYQDNQYLGKKNLFLEETKSKLNHIDSIVVEDFYSECVMSKEERDYMHNLKALGSNADMIKTRAIINNSDRCQHLQIDSNTIVPSFNELYINTFHAVAQKDGINASYYDDFYVSAHNKMIYTTPTGYIAQASQLEIHLWEWCRDHQNDDQDKQPEKNSNYSKVFTKALRQIDYVKEFTFRTNKTVFPATLDDKVYWLTNCMVTALNMSWSTSDLGMNQELKQLPAVRIGDDGLFNYQCFLNVIKKYTGDLSVHSIALGLNDSSAKGDASRDLLLHVSNCELELQASRDFMVNAIQKVPHLTTELLILFEDTKNGNELTKKLFDCSVKELPEKINASLLSQDAGVTMNQEDEKVTSRPGL